MGGSSAAAGGGGDGAAVAALFSLAFVLPSFVSLLPMIVRL